MISLLIFDVDGVITDGRKYVVGNQIMKNIAMKDIDALSLIKDMNIKIACITGEDDKFAKNFMNYPQIDAVITGAKNKLAALKELEEKFQVGSREICYIGDGKYDISVLQEAGLAICPADAIDEVKKEADIILTRKGGDGCLAEIYTLLKERKEKKHIKDMQNHKENGGDYKTQAEKFNERKNFILQRVSSHIETVNLLKEDTSYWNDIVRIAEIVCESYKTGGCLFFCGNGGSAADAQHLAAELVGRFYKERRALNSEALSTNTSILTCLANDYDYDIVFARQVEAKGRAGDVIVGITTSGTSKNILLAFEKAKAMGMTTVLMTGNVSDYLPLVQTSDFVLKAPSKDTPRIQEMHIMTGHILCEIIENKIQKTEDE